MAKKSKNIRGTTQKKSKFVLLIIDMINGLQEVDHATSLLTDALLAAKHIEKLRSVAKRKGIPIIYVNDNFGHWRSDLRKIIAHSKRDECLGKPLVEKMIPEEKDYFILKPKHSAFFATALDLLLDHLGSRKVILTGMTANQCILITANDAHMRDFELYIPKDCIIASSKKELDFSLFHFEKTLRANTMSSEKLAQKLKSSRK